MNLPPQADFTFRELDIRAFGVWSAMARDALRAARNTQSFLRPVYLRHARACAEDARYFYACITEEQAP